MVLALPVEADVIDFFAPLLLIPELDHIYPHILEDIAYLDAVVELILLSAKGLRRQATLFGEGLDVVLEIHALVDFVVADDDEGLLLVEKLEGHALHVGLGTSPR